MNREELLAQILEGIKNGTIPKWVFHGTDQENLSGIRKEGLLPRIPGHRVEGFRGKPSVYVTQRPKVAEQFVGAVSDQPALLRARLAPLLPDIDDEGLSRIMSGLEHRTENRHLMHGKAAGWPRELRVQKSIPARNLKVQKGTKFTKLGPAALLLALLGPLLSQQFSGSEGESV